MMEGQVYNLMVDWSIALASLFYCHGVGKLLSKGTTRFLALFPIICLFFYLPLNLTTMVPCGLTFFFMSWLGSFKLILFAFGQGPLAPHPPLPLAHFILTACLPIKIIQTDPVSGSRNQENPSPQNVRKPRKGLKDRAPSFILFFVAIKAFPYRHHLHPVGTTTLYAYFLFFMLEGLLAAAAAAARAVAGVELEPQFDDPHRATSVQDFWGKRWNLMVSAILRPTVYHPSRALFRHVVGDRWVAVPAVFSTFVVSGIMHEMIFYYLGRLPPTWEVTWFFVLHGAWVGAEIVVKKTVGHRLEPPRSLARALTLTFVLLTSFWLFFPPLLRFDPYVRACREAMAFAEFLKHGRLLNPNDCPCPYI